MSLSNRILPVLLIVLFYLYSCHHETEPPNIIFLLTDDLRYDALGCTGNEIIQTPHIDQLAVEGVLFENAYVTTSICAISRASILSGQYASRTGILDFATEFSPEALARTYPMLLKEQGYYTGFVGKFGIGDIMPDGSFDFWRGLPGQPRYEHFDQDSNLTHYTRIVSDQCREFISGCSTERPFCLSVSFKSPHVQDGDPRQFIYNPAYADLYRDDFIPVPETASDDFYYAFPEFFTRVNEGRRRWDMRFSTPEKYQESVKGYYRLITGVDEVVGEIASLLEQMDLDDNTLIIFTSDNGFYLGEHGLAGKWYGHEESIRIPMIIYDPRLPQNKKGIRLKHIALNIDIAPTILDFCHLDKPSEMQGVSLRDVIEKPEIHWREDFYYEHLYEAPAEWNVVIHPSEGVVGLHTKYLSYRGTDPPYEELYDLWDDPLEKHNLAGSPGHSDLLMKYRGKLEEYRNKVK